MRAQTVLLINFSYRCDFQSWEIRYIHIIWIMLRVVNKADKINFCFCIFQFYNLTAKDNAGYEENEIPSNPDIEPVSVEQRKKVAVRIRDVKKTFYPRRKDPIKAVDGVSIQINMYFVSLV